ncbi:MAG: hypothetical protein ACREFP_01985, partial [Acetobacteraceae bacterium]
AAFHPMIAGPVYAQPLYWRPKDGGRAMLIVATEQDAVYALDPETGAVIWKRVLGTPVPPSKLPCGDINPMGITGTPVIDGNSGVLYLDVMAIPTNEGPPVHEIFALRLEDGTILPGWPIDVADALAPQGKKFIAANQGERGALAIAGDKVFVAYAGHFGDCAFYHGWVVGAALQNPKEISAWSTRAQGGGIWGQGGVVSDGKALYVATGNTMGARSWGDGEAVIRLGLDLGFTRAARDYFAPADWHRLDARDLDLGGTNPLLVMLPGNDGGSFIVQLGKDGNAYLLDAANLGGIGGAIAEKRVSTTPIRTAPAAYISGGALFVAFQGEGTGCPAGHSGDLVALRIEPQSPHISVAWCAEEHGQGAPIVTTIGESQSPIVWAAGAEGDNRLRGFRGSDGAIVFDGGGLSAAMSGLHRYQTLIAAGGRLYVAADSTVYAFGPR